MIFNMIIAAGGGGPAQLQEKTVSPTESQIAVEPDVGYDGLSRVNVNAISSSYVGSGITRRSSADLLSSGPAVTAPAGYYANNASTSVTTGTEGTPTATKGTVSNHAVTVTPSVTNVGGYIAGGTRTGTGVSVAASELVSGTKSITENGTGIDVTNYASVDVSVSGYEDGDNMEYGSQPAPVSDLTGTSWRFHEQLDVTNMYGAYEITFESPYYAGDSFDYLSFFYGLDRIEFTGLRSYQPYNYSWIDNAARNISISGGNDATNATLFAWMAANATQVS